MASSIFFIVVNAITETIVSAFCFTIFYYPLKCQCKVNVIPSFIPNEKI